MSWQYIAGFFDGEGSIVHNGKGYRVTISQTNFLVLKTIQDFAGFGYIFQNRKRKAHWKESWVYYVAKQAEVYILIKNILPFIIVKKDLAIKVLPELSLTVEKHQKQIINRLRIIREAKLLRSQGLTYRKIGIKLSIDWGYARRIILK